MIYGFNGKLINNYKAMNVIELPEAVKRKVSKRSGYHVSSSMKDYVEKDYLVTISRGNTFFNLKFDRNGTLKEERPI
jgi:hypothetical protein